MHDRRYGMTALLKLVPDVIKIPVAMLLGAIIAFYPVSWYGASQEKSRVEIAQLTKSVEVIRDRQATNVVVAAGDASDVCRSLGLSEQNYRECMRRVAANDTVLEHVGGDNSDRPTVCEPSGVAQQVRSPAGLLVPVAPRSTTAAH